MAEQNKDAGELVKVRRNKLEELQSAGKNPFEIMKYDTTHHSMEIKDHFEELEGSVCCRPDDVQEGHGKGFFL